MRKRMGIVVSALLFVLPGCTESVTTPSTITARFDGGHTLGGGFSLIGDGGTQGGGLGVTVESGGHTYGGGFSLVDDGGTHGGGLGAVEGGGHTLGGGFSRVGDGGTLGATPVANPDAAECGGHTLGGGFSFKPQCSGSSNP